MKNMALSALAVSALAGSTLAVVQEPVTVGTQPVFFAATAAASLANGITLPVTLSGYTTRGVRVTGSVTTNLAGSFDSDLRLSIFAPGSAVALTTVQVSAKGTGGTFPINFAWSPPSSAAVPTGMPQTPGDWTITLWDAVGNGDTTAVQATFENLVISMDDDISPASVATPLDMTTASGSTLHTFNLGDSIKWYLVTVPAANNAAVPPSYFEIFTGGPNTILSDSELTLWQTNQAFNAAGVTAPINTQQVGSRLAIDFQDGDGQQAALSFGIGSGLVLGSSDGTPGGGADGNLAAGQYYLAVVAGQRGYFARNWGSLAVNDTFDGQVDINWRSGTRSVFTPTVVNNLGTLPINTTVAGGANPLTGAKWFKFVAPTDIGFMSNNFLDLLTAPGSGTATDTELAIFRELTNGTLAGTLVAQNDNITAGTNLFSRLSFGAGAGVGSTTGGTGQSGALAGGNTYWVAAANFDAAFSNGFGANAPAGPDFDVIFATGSRTPVDNTGIPATFTTLPFPSNTTTTTEVTLAANEVKWFKMTIPVELNNTTGKHLDIWTSAVADVAARPVDEDTEIALYSRDGRGNIDDDDGPDPFYSQLTYGGGAARAAILNSSAFDGRDSGLSADDYYIAVGLFDVTYGFNFVATPLAPEFGSVNLNLRSNHTVVPPCSNPSNVAGANQSTTPDDALTADDIIVFLGRFFANNTLSDVAGANQATIPDGNFTADDIIVFLGRYFQGC